MSDPKAFNVADYGAKGDGFTDDGLAISAAVHAALGRRVIVPPGTHQITKPIEPDSKENP